MHAAMSEISFGDVKSVQPKLIATDTYRSLIIDFNEGSDSIKLANMASLLIANIASLKDHLKAWCKSKQVLFKGDQLIDSNASVALIHDLWNVDKHAILTSAPRSGKTPKLINLSKVLSLNTGGQPGSASVAYYRDPTTGKMAIQSTGNAEIQLTGSIVDSSGNVLADFHGTCVKAISAWEIEIAAAGVPAS